MPGTRQRHNSGRDIPCACSMRFELKRYYISIEGLERLDKPDTLYRIDHEHDEPDSPCAGDLPRPCTSPACHLHDVIDAGVADVVRQLAFCFPASAEYLTERPDVAAQQSLLHRDGVFL